ncbi:MAG: type II toxin-antitoxin system VapC family toxin [Cytophagaceae bacterium]
MILCDTNIFIEVYKGNDDIINELKIIGTSNTALSDITIGEIYYGMRKREEAKTKELIKQFGRYPLTKDISKKFIELISDPSVNKIGLPDCLIAATALVNSLEVYTLNVKHFQIIKGLKLYKPKAKKK